MEQLGRIVAGLMSGPNVLFSGVILLVVAYALLARLIGLGRGSAAGALVRSLPGLCTTIGILGTFYGIAIGLLGFDVKDIDGSIEPLLAGMQLAFLTSLFGVSASLCLRIVYGVADDRLARSHPDAGDDPVQLLRSMQSSLASLDSTLHTVFRSDEEYSLPGQLKLVRLELKELRDEFKRSFESFAEQLAKQSQEALIEALNDVLGEFNTMLGELAGAAFEELRASIDRLNTWQEAHHQQQTDLAEQLTALVASLSEASGRIEALADTLAPVDSRLEAVATSVENLSVDADDLASTIKTIHSQTEQLSALLGGFEKLGERAAEVLPTIDAALGRLGDDLQANVDTVGQQLASATESMTDAATTHVSEVGRLVKDATEAQRETAETMRTTTEAALRTLDEYSTKQRALIEQSNKQLEEALSSSLGSAMESFAGAIGTISTRFADDYGPVADRLREVVRLTHELQARERGQA